MVSSDRAAIMVSRTMKTYSLLVVPLMVGLGWMVAAESMRAAPKAKIEIQPIERDPYDAGAIDRTIAFHNARVARDPHGAIGWAMLGEAWLERARESDLDSAAWEAEAAARKSLALRHRGNGRAFHCLVNSLLEQHRFHDAIVAMDSYQVRDRQYADALIEVGRYDEARQLARKLNPKDPAVAAIDARLLSLSGDHASSLARLDAARSEIAKNPATSFRTLAWYDVKAANELDALGQTKESEERLSRALDMYPRSYKATLGLAHLYARQGRWDEAETYARRTQTIVDSIEARAILADVHKAKGNEAQARKGYRECFEMYQGEVAKFEKLGHGGPLKVRPIDRQFATFCVEHGLFENEGIVAARRDLANRPDPTAQKNLRTLESRIDKGAI
jgi:tetratricopeptide (TPR) repeat protein